MIITRNHSVIQDTIIRWKQMSHGTCPRTFIQRKVRWSDAAYGRIPQEQ